MAGTGACCVDAAATKCTEILVDKVMKELPYLCCYKSYAFDFEEKKEDLKAAVESVGMKIKEAQKRNETQIDPIVENWVQNANKLIQQETTPEKWSSRYSMAKDLERMTQEIPTMTEKAKNFSQVAHAAEHPGMKFYSVEFMHFKSRGSILEQLREELKDGSKCRIGLQAMGGSGKTTMAKAVAKELENSKVFDKVIFIEVPNLIDKKKIRYEIAMKLELKLEGEMDLTHAEQIWTRIANDRNVLIVLDDVWEKINLEKIGIHHGLHNKGRCCILLTTRYKSICTSMGCQKTIELDILHEEDAVDLFLHHACESGKDYPNKSKFLASKIVEKCGRLPVLVVALAKTFRNWDPNEWEDAFMAIEKDSSLRHGNVDEEEDKFYSSLKMSFKNLVPVAQDLILLCSIFPRAYEIPVELLNIIATGMGLCENVESYYRARSQVLSIKTTLISSALLLTATEGCVKMHDVIRDMAQEIEDEKIQVITNSETKLKEKVKYSSWILHDFYNHFEANNLEVLLVWVNANSSLEVPNTFFKGMKGLRVLLLCSKREDDRTHALSLPMSIQSLENIQTLSLTNWELGDISILQNLKNLLALELTNCSIIELPNDFSQLEKLRLLGLVHCAIKRNNPFEAIGKCLKLEVLYYVSNYDSFVGSNAKPSKITNLQEFGIYHIEGCSSRHSFHLDASTKKYFNSTMLKGVLSESTTKYLAARAEILELTECEEAKWTNLIPDMVHPKEDGGMNDLTKLYLESWPAMRCLINTNDIQSDATVFSNLVELRLYDMCMRELCYGDFPNDFLKQLEKLDLNHCVKLEGTLLKGNLELSNLKSVEVMNCSMASLFHLSTAQTLKQLENLRIIECPKLRCIVSVEEQKVHDHHSVFPNLEQLHVESCNNLEYVLPSFYSIDLKHLKSMTIKKAEKMHYVFGKCHADQDHKDQREIDLPALKELSIEDIPNMVSICTENYFVKVLSLQDVSLEKCLQLPINTIMDLSIEARKIEENLSNRKKKGKKEFTCFHHIITKGSKAKSVSSAAAHSGYLPPPFYRFNLRKIVISGFSGLTSLFTLSIVSSLEFLETLEVNQCDTLEHIITDHDGHHMNVHSFFPNLLHVYVGNCNNLEYVFPAFYSKGLEGLEFISIWKAEKIRYVFGKCGADDNKKHKVQSKLNLPSWEKLYLEDVPDMVSICAENYFLEVLHLKYVTFEGSTPFIDFFIGGHKRQEDLSKKQALYMEPKNFMSFQNLSKLSFVGCNELKFIMFAPTTRSIPKLRELTISDCEELVSIIEDDERNQENPFDLHPSCCFPELRRIQVNNCMKMKCLFYISTCPKLPRLLILDIKNAPELVQVFDEKNGAHVSDVLPNLVGIRLINLPSFRTIYQGIDFQSVKIHSVHDCVHIPSVDNISSSEMHDDFDDSFDQDHINLLNGDDNDIHFILQWNRKVKREQIQETIRVALLTQKAALQFIDGGRRDSLSINNKRDSTIQKQKRSSPNLTEIEEEGSQQDIGKDSPNFDMAATTSTYDSNNDLCGKESMVDEQAQRESGSSKNEAPQRVEEPIHQSSSRKTSNEVLLKIPPPSFTEMTSAVTTQIETSTTHKEMESSSSQSDLSTISAVIDQTVQELCDKVSKGDQEALGEGTTTKVALEIPPTTTTSAAATEIMSPLEPSNTLEKPHIATSIVECPQVESTVNRETFTDEEEMKSDQKSPVPQIFEEHDLMRLFQMMKEGYADMEVDLSYVPKLIADLQHNQEVTKALSNLEASLKMGLNKIASSEESRLRLYNSLNILSSHCSEDEASSHGLQTAIQSLQQQIQNILSSFNQAHATINDTMTSLEQKEKLMIEQRSQREKDAKILLSDIEDTKTCMAKAKNSVVEAQIKEAELKEQLSKLQSELRSKEKEIDECEGRLLLLQEHEKKSVSDTIGFSMEFLEMEKEKSLMVEDQMKARQQLENMEAQWSYCLSNLKKATMLLGVHLKQKL